MKFVKKCVSMPEDAYKYAQQKAIRVTKHRGSICTVSSVIAELIAADKRRQESEERKAA